MNDSTFPLNIIDIFDTGPNRKYYVYRLVDPRTLHTFYVGKGCGDRVFQHAKGVLAKKSFG